MKGKHQRTAHELAQLACRLAAGLDGDDISSFTLERDLVGDCTRVTLHLTTGDSRSYTVFEEKEEPGRSAPSLPF